MVENLRAADAGQIEMFAEILGLSEYEVRELLDAEKWYSASEAVDAGLATARMGEPEEEGEPEGGGDHERRAEASDEAMAEASAEDVVAEPQHDVVKAAVEGGRADARRQIAAIQGMTL